MKMLKFSVEEFEDSAKLEAFNMFEQKLGPAAVKTVMDAMANMGFEATFGSAMSFVYGMSGLEPVQSEINMLYNALLHIKKLNHQAKNN